MYSDNDKGFNAFFQESIQFMFQFVGLLKDLPLYPFSV